MFDETQQLNDEMILTWGLGFVSTDAFASGVGAMPDPAGEVDYPWLWWGQMHLLSLEANTQPGAWGITAQRLEVDTKAMRKFKPGQSLAWILQIGGSVGAPSVELNFGLTRVLIGT